LKLSLTPFCQGLARLAAAFARMALRMLLQGFDHGRIILPFRSVLQYRPAEAGQLTRTSLRKPSALQRDGGSPTLTGC